MLIRDNTIDLQNLLTKINSLPETSRNMDFENNFITKNISAYENSKLKIIGNRAFQYCYNLTSISFPACITIGSSAFYNCSNLTAVNFPNCATIGNSAFGYCSSLTSIDFPNCSTIGDCAFYSCSNLTSIDFPNCSTINFSAFQYCYRLSQLYLTGSSLCKLSNSYVFFSTPYGGYSNHFSGTPYIYVPESLVTSYKNATNWTYFSRYIVPYNDAN